jgi:hypothetical protein
VRYVIYEADEGPFLLRGVKTGAEWFRVSQSQRVNGRWTSTGCHWYSEEEIKRILESRGKMIKEGEGEIEYIGKWCVLVEKDADGFEHLI